MSKPIFDLHTHFSFKPANSGNYKNGKFPDPNHWDERYRTRGELQLSVANMVKGVLKTSQAHGKAAVEGQLRILCNSMYPLERGFTEFLVKKDIANLTGHDLKRIKQINSGKISYFDHLQLIYANLLGSSNKMHQPSHEGKYKLVNSYKEITSLRQKNKKLLCVINSIEGCHSFASDLKDDNGNQYNLHLEEQKLSKTRIRTGDSPFEKHIDQMVRNIAKVKNNWNYPPFFVTFSHHYYNHLVGHSPSLGFFINLIVKQSGKTKIESGRNVSYYQLGFRRWGMKILTELLKRKDPKGNNVRRILIDTKHLSVQGRIDYHRLQKIRKDIYQDPIPIIQSHTAVSGRRSMQQSVDAGMAMLYGEKKRSQYFNPTELNLFDDEIVDIIASDGLIGIMIDEKRIIGKKIPPESGFMNKRSFKKQANISKNLIATVIQYKHRILWEQDSKSPREKLLKRWSNKLMKKKKALKIQQQKVKPAFISVLFRQLFHIVSVSGPEAWNHLTLGTDYEGVINPMDIYPQSKDLQHIEQDMISFWNKQLRSKDIVTRHLYREMLHGEQVKTIVRKFLWNNANSFLKKYFNDNYLRHGK